MALALVWLAIAFYGETEGQWFNSYLVNVAGGNDYYKAVMVSTSALVGTVAFIFWGVISDNLRTARGRRVPILVPGLVATAFFVWLFGRTTNLLALIVIDGFVIGFTSNMFHCASRALVPDLFPKQVRGRVNFLSQVCVTAGSVGTWVLALSFLPEGGGQYSRWQYDVVWVLCAVLLVVAGAFSAVLIREPEVLETRRGTWNDVKLMFDRNEMAKHRDFLKLFVASLFVIMSTNAYRPWMLELLQDLTFTTGEFLAQVAVALAIFVPILWAYFHLVDRWGRKRMVLLALYLVPLSCLILAFSRYQISAVVTGIALMFSLTLGLNVALDTWTQDLLDPEARAKFLGIINVGKAAGQVPGVVLAAAVAEAFGDLTIFLVSAAFLLLAIPLFKRVPETL
ncbi:MAG: hypothetical protein Kow0069_25210 [Promethearchaeota archaeon]